MNRRKSIQLLGAGAVLSAMPGVVAGQRHSKVSFQYCLNTSTINGSAIGIKRSVELAARAGYDFVELWLPDIKEYLRQGNTIASLKQHISDSGISIASAIGFAPWMVPDPDKRKAGFKQMEDEMNIMADLGARRIAAAPAGLVAGEPIDLLKTGEYYRELIALGRKTGVMPQLEFWGGSPSFFHLGQVLMVVAAANDRDARILADVFHLFKGGSGFDSLKLIRSEYIEIFHINDYSPAPAAEQKDKDRIFPGDGVAPLKQILTDLASGGGSPILSLELFNEAYWRRDALEVAKTGLRKMRNAVEEIAR
jgi:2-keto-myo-inositol isomerase